MLDKFLQKLETTAHEVWDMMWSWLAAHALNVVLIVIGAFIVRRILARVITQLIGRTMRRDLFPTELDRKKRLETLDGLIGATTQVFVWVVAIVMIISELGINTAPLLASAGIIGIAFGFGAQSLVKDFFSGIFIILENQYRVGDIVEISQISGVVEDITIRTTVVRDLNGQLHHIPNGSIVVTTNKTMDFAQINEDIIVGLDTDVEKIEEIINEVGKEVARISAIKDYIVEPPHFERLDGFTNDGMRIKVLGKTTPGEQWIVKGKFYTKLKAALDKNKIEIPYQHITLDHLKKK